jgi:hypothetical protein
VTEIGAVVPAPLPSQPLRVRAMSRLGLLRAAGGRVLVVGSIPDDIEHRMGWRIPSTVVDRGDARMAAPLLFSAGTPLGSTLTVVRGTSHHELDAIFTAARHLDGYAGAWSGFGDERIRFGVLAREQSPLDVARGGLVPSAWTGENPARRNGVHR